MLCSSVVLSSNSRGSIESTPTVWCGVGQFKLRAGVVLLSSAYRVDRVDTHRVVRRETVQLRAGVVLLSSAYRVSIG